jgi:ABC-type branched-subunit amino acid transport system ATPase component/branched-subunit amino acid ABC-type transport system permease component
VNVLPFVVTGLITGVLYGLAASGLVLTFKTSGLFNIGYGAVLTAATVVFYAVRVTLRWDWKIAFAVSVFIAGPLMGLVMEYMARYLSLRSTSLKVAGTAGLIVLVPSLCLIFYPNSIEGLLVQPYLPFANRNRYRLRLFDVNVFGDQLLTVAIVVLVVSGLFLLLRFTRMGTTMRAVVDDPTLLDLQGTNPVRVRRLAWVLGCMFAALSGVLIVPSVGLDPYALTFLATYSFAAAALGRFTSIPLAFVGGLLVGVAQDVTGYVVNSNGWATLSGLPDALPFVILCGALLVIPKRRLAVTSEAELKPQLQWSAPVRVRIMSAVIVVGVLASVPAFAASKLSFFSFGLCQALLVLSLGLLVRTSGQVSLCHATFAAIGAAAFSQFTVGAGIPWMVAFLMAGLVVVPVGALVALPAIRLSGIYLAVATFGFGILVQRLIFPQTWMFFTFAGSRTIPSPFGISSASGRYFVVLTVLVVASVLVTVISASRLGRVLRGMAGTETAVSTLGLSINVTKVLVFCLSAFLASLAGVMYGMVLTNVDSGTAAFQPYNSFVLIAILAIQPFREPWYALTAGVGAVIPGFFSGNKPTLVLDALFGIFALMVGVQGGQLAAPEWVRALGTRFDRRSSTRVSPTEVTALTATEARSSTKSVAGVRASEATAGGGLQVEDLNVRFGGLVAVDAVSLSAPLGRITGLIGPNGAGKTTIFNACSGLNSDVHGRVVFNGIEISRRGAPARARLGLGRTFQRMELCDSLSVVENVALGYECPSAGSRPLRQFAASSSQRRAMGAAASQAMKECGIDHLAQHRAGALSTGQRRLVELARCLAGPFTLLLLDEPSSGLDRSETDRFGEVLTRIVEERECGLLLVEHDMSLVMRVCTKIYVLDFGRLIFEGAPREVSLSPVVRAAYLGTDTPELKTLEVDAV